MPTLLASHRTTGARLRQFVLELLHERGLTIPADYYQLALDDYLSAPTTTFGFTATV